MAGEDPELDPPEPPPSVLDDPPPAADEAGVKAQVERAESYAKQRETFWRGVLADPVGRREMWAIIGVEAHAFEVKYACGPNGAPDPDASRIAFAEQQLGQRLYQTLQLVDFDGAFLMLAENDPRFKKPKRKR